jgi:cytochrome c556
MRVAIVAAFGGVALVLAVGALAASPADEAVQARQTALKAMGHTFKEIHGIGAGDVVAKRALLVADAAKLKTEASQPWRYFGPETQGATIKTEALPVIWSDTATFKADQTRLTDAVAALDAVAATGSPDEIEQKAGAVGAACGACHRAFKAK